MRFYRLLIAREPLSRFQMAILGPADNEHKK